MTRQRWQSELNFNLDSLYVRGRPQRIDRNPHNRRQIERTQIETKIAGDDARNVEQIVDEPRLRTRVALDGLDSAFEIFDSIDFAVANHRGPTEDRSQRRAQLM